MTERQRAMFAALIDTAKRTTDLDNVYNDSLTPDAPYHSFSWAEIEQELATPSKRVELLREEVMSDADWGHLLLNLGAIKYADLPEKRGDDAWHQALADRANLADRVSFDVPNNVQVDFVGEG